MKNRAGVEIFRNIADKYDLLNAILSFGAHKSWRRKAVAQIDFSGVEKILDLASGTGDLAIELRKKAPKNCEIIASDLNENMLEIAKRKFRERGLEIKTEILDAVDIACDDDSFDVSTIAFGIRNAPSIEECLCEMARTTKSGGQILIAEFGQPTGFFKYPYAVYSKTVFPILGGLLAGDSKAYDYLRETSARFPCGEDFTRILKKTGKFRDERYVKSLFGLVYIYTARVK